MTFLTSIDILDTGYLTKDKSTTRLSTADMVNSGNALRLKGVEISISSSGNLDKSPTPGRFSTNAIPLISLNPREINIRIAVNTRNTDTSNQYEVDDMAYIAELIKLAETKGVKAIYYPVDETATGDTRNMDRQIIWCLGAVDTDEPQTGISISLWNGSAEATGKNLTNVRYLACRFDKVDIPQRIDGVIEINISGVITA